MPALSIMIAGAQKSGTSSLNTYLGQHPSLRSTREDADGQSPEIMWFLRPERFDDGIPWSFLYGEVDEGELLVGKSAGLMYDGDAVERLAAHDPRVHVVVVLRDPVKRAFSAYQFNKQRGIEPASSFEDALAGGPQRFRAEDERHFRCAYVEWSAYADHVERLLRRFGEDRVHVLLFEELTSDPRRVVAPLLEKLGLDPADLPEGVGHANEASQSRSLVLARAVRPGHPLARVLRKLLPLGARHRLRVWLRSVNTSTSAKPRSEQLSATTTEDLSERLRDSTDRLGRLLGRNDLPDWWSSAKR